MNRFFGMMPQNEVSISKRFKDPSGLKITIQAGEHGWTIIYADNSTDYKDVDATAKDNFNEAYALATKNLGPLVRLDSNNNRSEVR